MCGGEDFYPIQVELHFNKRESASTGSRWMEISTTDVQRHTCSIARKMFQTAQVPLYDMGEVGAWLQHLVCAGALPGGSTKRTSSTYR